MQLLSNEAPCTFTTEEILGANGLLLLVLDMLQIDLDWICLICSVVLEAGDRPRPIYINIVFLHVIDEHILDMTLV
jgi:hypothetical protein